MGKDMLLYQLKFPAIRHKSTAIGLLIISVIIAIIPIWTGLSLWISVGGLCMYLLCLLYCVYESIRLRSYLIVVTFLGMMAIGVYMLLMLFCKG